MKRYSTYLRKDQIQFLKNTTNASSFVREALDMLIKSDRAKPEKIIVIVEAIKELEQKIEEQQETLTQAQQEQAEINKKIEKAEYYIATAQKIIKGDIQTERNEETGKYESYIQWKEEKILLKTGTDEQTLKESTIKLGKTTYEKATASLSKDQKAMKLQTKLVEAHETKLETMQKELEELKSNV